MVKLGAELARIDDLTICSDPCESRHLSCFNLAADDMHNLLSCSKQVVADDPAMTAPPGSFGTHDGHAVLLAKLEQEGKIFLEVIQQSIIGVIVKALLLPALVDVWINGLLVSSTGQSL